jgi:NTP pyrophosphatase (non-canonical NTP hydrolase)
MRNSTSIKSTIEKVIAFRNDREWEKFHNGKDLAICLNREASELLELFLWKSSDEVDVVKLKEELADVLYSAFLLVEKYQLDVDGIISSKLKSNALKYPIDKSKGSNKKYNDL